MGATAITAAALIAGVISARDSTFVPQSMTLEEKVENIYNLGFGNFLAPESTIDSTSLFFSYYTNSVPNSMTLYENGIPIKTYVPEVADNLQAGRQINFLTVPDRTDSGYKYLNWGRLVVVNGRGVPQTKDYFLEVDMGSHIIRTPTERISFLGGSPTKYKDDRYKGPK